MFKQHKKARELMGRHKPKGDEFDFVKLFLWIIIFLAIIWVYFYEKKVDEIIKENKKTNNPIIKDLQKHQELKKAEEIYGPVKSKAY